ncbi:F-box/FBD/LRR-repeat protein At1g13570-like [Cornus florida]|uniref:F-box/FBD/LRR-repeat protein At1g13570-like n=1 Tax=Cornus florida TaxID=4283 RepID=UPI00289DB4B6|nr:F-box/FBD/LRR-repeat protein At1g13570-like [Cornus florida]
MMLPLRDAARTSILSKKWRFYWLKLPQLVFDDTMIQDSMKNQNSLQSKLLMTIYQVLLLHNGPIVKFTLSISELEGCYEIYPLILVLSRGGIKELTIDIFSITSNDADGLNLEHVEEGEASEMLEVFGCLPVIETLKLGFRFMKFLTMGGVPERLLFTLDHLKVLQLNEIYFGEIVEVSFALCLIKSSPNLKKIEIEVFTSKDGAPGPLVLEFLEMQDYSDASLKQLREVKMRFISGTRPELEFIKLILAKSPMLESMLIESNTKKIDDNGVAILTELTRFRRISPNVEIIYKAAD